MTFVSVPVSKIWFKLPCSALQGEMHATRVVFGFGFKGYVGEAEYVQLTFHDVKGLLAFNDSMTKWIEKLTAAGVITDGGPSEPYQIAEVQQ